MLPHERFLVSKDSFDYVKGEINGIAPENIFLPVRGKIEDPNLSKYFIHQATIFESDGTMHLILLCYFGDAIRWAVSAEKNLILYIFIHYHISILKNQTFKVLFKLICDDI